MEFQDYYNVLGIPRNADDAAIRQAYRQLAQSWHPDKKPEAERPNAEAKFKRISEAYEVLSDPDKRSRYDRFGENWEHGQEFTPPPGGGRGFSAGGGADGFSDFFREMFGGQDPRARGRGGQARHRHRGHDVRADLPLKISDAVRGGKRDFDVPTSQSCEQCGGVGSVDDHICYRCAGVGTSRQSKTVSLSIPADVYDGQTLRLSGLGEPGRGPMSEPGNLLLTIRLLSDEVFRLEGQDVIADVPVAPWEAVEGVRVELRTPAASQPVTMTVPAGTASGTRLRLRGQGLPQGKAGTRGDFYIVIRYSLPEELSEKQRELLAELGRLSEGAAIVGGARVEGEGVR